MIHAANANYDKKTGGDCQKGRLFSTSFELNHNQTS